MDTLKLISPEEIITALDHPKSVCFEADYMTLGEMQDQGFDRSSYDHLVLMGLDDMVVECEVVFTLHGPTEDANPWIEIDALKMWVCEDEERDLVEVTKGLKGAVNQTLLNALK